MLPPATGPLHMLFLLFSYPAPTCPSAPTQLSPRFLGKPSPGFSDQDKVPHYIRSWLHVPLVWRTVTVTILNVLVWFFLNCQPYQGWAMSASLTAAAPADTASPGTKSHESLLNGDQVLYWKSPCLKQVQREGDLYFNKD